MTSKKNTTSSATRKPANPKTITKPPKPRRIKEAAYQSFKLQRRIKNPGQALTGSFKLFWRSLTVLKKNWKIFVGVLIIYGLVDFIVVQGFSAGQNYGDAKTTIKSLFSGSTADLASGVALFLYMVGSGGAASGGSAGASPYQFIWILITSLALIWALRQTYAGSGIRIRDAYYRGMYPLITFVMVLGVVALQLFPAILGGIVYNVASTGVASTGVERFMWALVFALLILLSLYLIVSSVFALYIVCLPDMTPMKALRSARQLVANRRWTVLRKVVFLPVALLVIGAVIVVPVILLFSAAASWVFFALTLLALPVLHSYYYALYRSLL
ncbi:MAG TPA: hypothetical protein VLG16_04400 [Candidatus Saccharimonadales bacterium]|nr:hypothetical protein [Candidatus Saccharimonadales bacterium]